MPIGNLTSQIFANVYLNEFDRFVRHELKPQAYVRYGDDFVIFGPTRKATLEFRNRATDFLKHQLGLSINPRNDIVIAARDGLKFLGHLASSQKLVVEPATTRRVMERINLSNAASYRALYLDENVRKQLDWILLEKLFDN